MADSFGEYLRNFDETDTHHVLILQSWVRGVLVRISMARVRSCYEQLVTEVEKDPNVCVHWQSDAVCKPEVMKKKRALKSDEATTRKTSIADRKNKDPVNQPAVEKHDKPKKTVNILDEKQTKSGNSARSETVETKDSNLQHDSVEDAKHLTGERDATEDQFKEETAFTSVETQTSLIENVPNKQGAVDETENVLDGIDTTWFNKAHKFENVAKEIYSDEDLHLDLDSELESFGPKHSEHGEHFTQKDQNSDRFEVPSKDRNIEGSEVNESQSDRSLKSCKSDLSARSRSSKGDRSKQEDFESYRSEESCKDSVSKGTTQSQRLADNESGQKSRRFNEERGQRSDSSGRSGGFQYESSHLSNSQRSHRSDYQQSHRSDGQRSFRSDSERSQRSESKKSHRSADRTSNRSEDQRSTRSEDRRSHRSNGKRSQRSDRSDEREGQRSDRSSAKAGQRSDRSDRQDDYNPKLSDDEEGQRSHRSDDQGGQMSDRSQRSARSHRSNGRHSPEQLLEKEPVKMPRQSSRSPVPTRSSKGDNSRLGQDSTTLTNVTSVWDSVNSVLESREIPTVESLPHDADKLRELRKSVAMELLWVQQAIQSRKNYLRLKGQI